jgi:two-component system sensor histidine kinase DegS
MGTPVRLPDATEVTVFRIVESALQNVAGHARATRTLINLDFGIDRLYVEVRDNGRGFDYANWSLNQEADHLGLVSMQERVRSLGGTMEVSSHPGEGTCLRFGLPLNRTQP